MPSIMASFYFILSLLFILSVKMKTTNLYVIFYFHYSSNVHSLHYFGQVINIFPIFLHFDDHPILEKKKFNSSKIYLRKMFDKFRNNLLDHSLST